MPNPMKKTIKTRTLWVAAAVAVTALTLAIPSAYATTVWNINVGDSSVSSTRQITTSDNYIGAAPENTANSTWNAISVSNNAVTTPGTVALVTSTAASSTVTINISSGSNNLNSGGNDLTTGDEVFSTWFKVNGNTGPMTVTFASLPTLGAGQAYALVIYSDWFFPTGGNMPITQTVGTGLTGTFNFNRSNDPGNGLVGPLLEDTDSANVAATASTQFNFVRLNGFTPSIDNELAFSMTPGNSAVSGFQLILVPEPSSALLGGLGLLALLRRRRA
jgi:hypothetical protein